MNIPPLRIVLSGGGIRGLSYAGCFLELEKMGYLNQVKEFLGVSCGALFAFAYTIGYTPNEIHVLSKSLDFSLIQNLDPDVAFNYLENYGIDDGANLEKFLESLLKNKGYTKEITYLELYENTNIHFRAFAVELNRCKLKEFSYKLTPDESVIFGLKASMCLPGYFIPLKKNNTFYIDGGLLNNYPMDLIPFEEHLYTLGFIFTKNTIKEYKIDNFFDYINQVFNCANKEKKKFLNTLYALNTILIPCEDFPMWNFNASEEERIYLIECGKKAVLNFYSNFKLRKPIRRNSVG